jgi:cytoskeleton protein RodZ
MSGATPNADLPLAETARIGQVLRQARTQRGMATEDVSRELHLQIRQIEAIEKGDYSAFSSPAIVKGHLRAFARLYGLDGNNLVHIFESALPQQKSYSPTKAGAINRMVLLPGRSNESVIFALLVIVIAALMITLMAYLWSAFRSHDWHGFFSTTNIENMKSDIVEVESGKKTAHSPAVLPVGQVAAPQPIVAESSVALVNQNLLAPAAEQVPKDVVLHIEFVDDCIARIKEEDGSLLHDQLHKKGETFEMVVAAPVHIYLSRAKAAVLSYNGSPVALPVKSGAVSVDLVLGDESPRSE